MRRGRRREAREEGPIQPPAHVMHQWLHFPANLENVATFNSRLERLNTREIEIAHTLDWGFAENIGLSQRLNPFLTQQYKDDFDDIIFECHAWRNLFQIREPVYRELMLEFYSTSMIRNTNDYNDDQALRFRLGGVSRNCSMREFSWRTGLYTYQETQDDNFLNFLSSAYHTEPEEFQPPAFWSLISDAEYRASDCVESAIRDPIHRMLHRLLTNSIAHRRGAEKVPTSDLFYLWCLIDDDASCNLPRSLAGYLFRRAAGQRESSPMCGGHFITRIARSYGILDGPAERLLLRFEPKDMGSQYLEAMRAIERDDDGEYRIVGDPVRRAGRERRGRRRRQQQQGQHDEQEINLQYLAQRIDGLGFYNDDLRGHNFHIENEVQWIGTNMARMFEQQRFVPSHPFPPSYPQYPDWRTRFPAADRQNAGPSHRGGEDSEEE